MSDNVKNLITFKEISLSNDLLKNKKDKANLYDLEVVMDTETKLVHLNNNVDSKDLFNHEYVYDSSRSITMQVHFEQAAISLQKRLNPKKVLEVGSNSGIFIKHFPSDSSIAVEPCSNFAKLTNDMGIKTYDEFWNDEVCDKILIEHGLMDLIYSANTFSHVQDLDDCLSNVDRCLSSEGTFVIETPSFLEVLKYNAFDQFYHEHHSYFTYVALQNILEKHHLKIYDIEKYKVHGGTYRFFICKSSYQPETDTEKLIQYYNEEVEYGANSFDIIKSRIDIMQNNMIDIKETLETLKKDGKSIVGYGSTAKFTNVMNMCGLNDNHIDYVLDTTPLKHYSYIPNTNVQILPYNPNKVKDIDYFYLGAWNYRTEVINKESDYLKNGGKFITHIPKVEIISE